MSGIVPRGLRARSTAGFALLALLVATLLSVMAYQLARWYLLDQREALATRQTMVNAQVANGIVAASADTPDLPSALRAASNARAVLSVDGVWYSTVVEFNEAAIPSALLDLLTDEVAAVQRVERNGTPYLVIGVRLPARDALYIEFVPLSEYARTMDTLGAILAAGAAVASLGGAVAGWLLSRRVLRPLAGVAAAAQGIAAGQLDRRLEVDRDPDLEPVATSFNEMAASLEARIEREVRFTADVSHELRTPLTAMVAAVGLARRAASGERATFAVEVLDQQVDHLRRLTLELLEISRMDAGGAVLQLEPVDVHAIVGRAMAQVGVPATRMRSGLAENRCHPLDPVRFERIVVNLLENAERYGGGVTAVELDDDDGVLVVHVDDAGPGVDPSERIAIFGRFHRGNRSDPEGAPKGTGLGLSLVEEHARLHGGQVTVTDSPWGGARFTVRLPKDAR